MSFIGVLKVEDGGEVGIKTKLGRLTPRAYLSRSRREPTEAGTPQVASIATFEAAFETLRSIDGVPFTPTKAAPLRLLIFDSSWNLEGGR